MTSPGCSGWRWRNVGAPPTVLPALSYQNSSTLKPAIGAEAVFFTLKVVTMKLASRFGSGGVYSMDATPRTGETSLRGPAGAAPSSFGRWAAGDGVTGAAGFACSAATVVARSATPAAASSVFL